MFDFLREGLADIAMVGSLCECSKYTVNTALKTIDFSSIKTIVEFGPGKGNFTKKLLTHANADATVTAFEINDFFVDHLQKTITDERLTVVKESCSNVAKRFDENAVDLIITTIPMSNMEPELLDEIFESSKKVLKTGGIFLNVQFTSTSIKYIKKYIGKIIKSAREPRNFLPTRIIKAVKI